MGRAEGLIALGISWQLLVITLTLGSPNPDRDVVTALSIIGFIIVAVGAWMTAWERVLR